MGPNVIDNLFSEFKGRRVLVTGDTGFKGSWLCLWLRELGADVVGFSFPPERENDHYNLAGLGKLIHHVDGDIREPSFLRKVFREFQPIFLFHLAAQTLVKLAYKDPKTTFDTNVGGSGNVLEAVRDTASMRSVIYVTSDKCYKNKDWIWGYRENDELGGRDPYSASKAAAELLFSTYLSSFFMERPSFGIASVRAGNVIGGGDWASDRIVPDSIRSLQRKRPIILRNPASTRPWQHVLEPLSGYLLLASKMYRNPKAYSGAWNFGPDNQSMHSVKELAEKIIQCWGDGKIKVSAQKKVPHEENRLQLNCDKSQLILGWRPRWDFNQAVEKTVSWYKEAMRGRPMRQFSKDQIMSYMEEFRD